MPSLSFGELLGVMLFSGGFATAWLVIILHYESLGVSIFGAKKKKAVERIEKVTCERVVREYPYAGSYSDAEAVAVACFAAALVVALSRKRKRRW